MARVAGINIPDNKISKLLIKKEVIKVCKMIRIFLTSVFTAKN